MSIIPTSSIFRYLLKKILERALRLLWEFIEREVERRQHERETQDQIDRANRTGNTSEIEDNINDLLT